MSSWDEGAASREQGAEGIKLAPATLTRAGFPLAGLALAVAVVFLSTNASASELQWRRGGPNRKPATSAAKPQAGQATVKRVHHDGAVRTVAFEDEAAGPTFAAHEGGSSDMRSVVVRESAAEAYEPVRAAQLQWGQPADNRYEDPSRVPFGSQPESAPSALDELEVDVEEGFAEEEFAPPPSPPNDSFNDQFRSPGGIELEAPADSDVRIKERQLREQPNMGPSGTFPREPALGPPGTRAFGGLQRAEELPDADVDPQLLAQEEQAADEDCEEALRRLRARRLADVNLNIAVRGTQGEDFPFECSIDDGQWYAGRHWCDTTYMWKASALCHKPLYFEDEALERYGHSWGPCLDPVVSGVHFFCKLPVLPYCMGVQPPNECVYALGHYRPGNCAPYLIDPVPISARGAAMQAGAVVGAAAILH